MTGKNAMCKVSFFHHGNRLMEAAVHAKICPIMQQLQTEKPRSGKELAFWKVIFSLNKAEVL